MLTSIKNYYDVIKSALRIQLIYSRGSSYPIFNSDNLLQKHYCQSRGFLADKYHTYNFKENNSKLYVSDIYDTFTHPKNGFYSSLIDSKALLNIILSNYNQYIPSYYFTIFKSNVLNHFKNCYIDKDDFIKELGLLLDKKKKIILKPFGEEGGKGFILLSKIDNTFYFNNDEISEVELNLKIGTIQKYICTEHVENVDYIKKIYPFSCNTIRFLTIWDNNENMPYIARAVHRFGVHPKSPVDNSRSGELSSEIDIKTGTLGKVFLGRRQNGTTEFSDFHPTTKSLVNGIKIENWENILSALKEIATSLPYFRYIGWDIALTNDGFRVIEINSNPSVRLFQVHRPLLTDLRIKDFFDQFKNHRSGRFFYEK